MADARNNATKRAKRSLGLAGTSMTGGLGIPGAAMTSGTKTLLGQ